MLPFTTSPFSTYTGYAPRTRPLVVFAHKGHDWIRGSEQCLLRTTVRDVEEQEIGLLFAKGRFTLEGKGPQVSLSPERRAILEFVRRSLQPVAPKSSRGGSN